MILLFCYLSVFDDSIKKTMDLKGNACLQTCLPSSSSTRQLVSKEKRIHVLYPGQKERLSDAT